MTRTVVGTCPDRFSAVRDVLDDALADGSETGVSFSVVLDDSLVVDLWGGWRDAARTLSWEADTVTNVWSLTKTVVSLAAFVLVDRGELDPARTVATYWPAYAENGKADTTVGELLSHTAGVPAWERPVAVTDLYDTERATALLARQAPWWPPGSAPGYHGISYGHLVGEVLRRITGMTLGECLASEVCRPLGVDFTLGLAPGREDAVADVVPPPPGFDLESLDHSGLTYRALTGPVIDAAVAATPGWRRAEIGASNGHGNARSLARLMSVLAGGSGTAGTPLLSEGTVTRALTPCSTGTDLVLGMPVVYGLGFGLVEPGAFPHVPGAGQAYWGGWGGSVAVADPERRLAMAFVMNQMAPSLLGKATGEALARELYAAL